MNPIFFFLSRKVWWDNHICMTATISRGSRLKILRSENSIHQWKKWDTSLAIYAFHKFRAITNHFFFPNQIRENDYRIKILKIGWTLQTTDPKWNCSARNVRVMCEVVSHIALILNLWVVMRLYKYVSLICQYSLNK